MVKLEELLEMGMQILHCSIVSKKTSYVLGSELWEDSLVKVYIINVWEVRKQKLCMAMILAPVSPRPGISLELRGKLHQKGKCWCMYRYMHMWV